MVLINILFLIPAVLVSFYYIVLSIVALASKTKQYPSQHEPKHKHTFAIVIPAHNEENEISNTLKSCSEIEYPGEKYAVYVIADNCSDRTASIAREHGVQCLERYDSELKGKGCALAWAFQRILPKSYDAVVVLDADCLIDSNALVVFDNYLLKGEKVLQSNFVSSNPDDSVLSYTLTVGNVIENEFFNRPKSILGLAFFLQGSGMVFHRQILEEYPWKANSITEDSEYTLELLRNGIHIEFVHEVRVSSKSPDSKEQLDIQRIRWASGNLSFGKTNALKLIYEGILKKHIVLIDAGFTFLVLSRPLVLLGLLFATTISLISYILLPSKLSKKMLLISIVPIFSQAINYSLGILRLGVSLRRLKLLLYVPIIILKLIFISVLGLIGIDRDKWTRTPR